MTDVLITPRLQVTGESGTIDLESDPPRLSSEQTYLIRLRNGETLPSNLIGVTKSLPGTLERLLRFGNFVGLADIDGTIVQVDTSRINAPQADRMIEELVEALEHLPSRALPPTGSAFDRPFSIGDDIDLLEYLVIREAVLRKGRHDLRSAVARILARPNERFEHERLERPIWATDRIDGQTMVELVARPTERIHVPPDSPFADAPIARVLNGFPPASVQVVRSIPTTDTIENRFVVTVLDRCLALVRSVVARAARDTSPGMNRLRVEAGQVADSLERWRLHRVLSDLQPLRRLPTTSTVLRGRPGYREVLHFYADLLGRTRIVPPTAAAQIVALRNIADLYEWWCFFQVIAAATETLGPPTRINLPPADWEGARLGFGTTATFAHDVTIQFNRTFSKASGKYGSYSLSLRPDILVDTPSGRDVFDAKFAFEPSRPWNEADEDEIETQDDSTRAWRSHIHKMHTYRDALDGVRSVRVLYPGDTCEWHQASVDLPQEGVGALPLRVGNGADALALRTVLAEMFVEQNGSCPGDGIENADLP